MIYNLTIIQLLNNLTKILLNLGEIKDKDAQKFIPHNKMMQLLLSCEQEIAKNSENPFEVTCCFKVFIAKIVEFGLFTIPYRKCVEACVLLLKSPAVVFNLEDFVIEKLEIEEESEEIKISDLIIKVIQYLEKTCPNVDFNEVFKVAEISRL